MNRIVSPYYPPRARWYSSLFGVWQTLQRRLGLDRLHLPEGLSASTCIASLLIPGLAFSGRKERLIGRAILLGYGLLAIVFIVWLGYPVANVAFGLMLSAHVTSIIFLLQPWLAEARLAFRMATGLILLLFVGGGVYAPLRNGLQTNFFMPLRIRENVVIVQTFSSPRSIRRGDRIVFSLESVSVGDAHREGGAVWARAGFGLGPVLAVAGDRIRFAPDFFEVNGFIRPRLPHMPKTGETVVPEKNWFIWPELAITGNENAQEAVISSTMLQMATVAETQFIGKPFKHWFWRRQIIS